MPAARQEAVTLGNRVSKPSMPRASRKTHGSPVAFIRASMAAATMSRGAKSPIG